MQFNFALSKWEMDGFVIDSTRLTLYVGAPLKMKSMAFIFAGDYRYKGADLVRPIPLADLFLSIALAISVSV